MLQPSNQVPQTVITNTSATTATNVNPTSHVPINDNVWNQQKPSILPTIQPHGTLYNWYNLK